MVTVSGDDDDKEKEKESYDSPGSCLGEPYSEASMGLRAG